MIGVTVAAALLVLTKVADGACPEANGFALAPACPDDSASYNGLPNCDDDLLPGDYCEGDGECGTSNINNCGNGWDVYVVRQCKQNILHVGLPYSNVCPGLNYATMLPCSLSQPTVGTFCEGDGECGTDNDVNSCGVYDVYEYCPTLTPIPEAECPPGTAAGDLPRCNETDKAGDLCQGDGECHTFNYLNNCLIPPDNVYGWDVYRVCAGSENGGSGLIPATTCPENVDFAQMPHCASSGLQVGDYCEGDGECGTDNLLNNCGPGGYDVYAVGGECPAKLSLAPVAVCPGETEKALEDLPNCAAPFLAVDDLCEGDGECGSSQSLNNCGNGWDVYVLEFGVTG